ncbi:MAG: helix-turn-helix domain-containing protein [Acidimicrobiales bacterium]
MGTSGTMGAPGAGAPRNAAPGSNAAPGNDVLSRAKALGEPRRFGIYCYLAEAGRPVGVAELAQASGLHHNAVRQHLAVLREAKLVWEEAEHRDRPGRPRLYYGLQGAPGELLAAEAGVPASSPAAGSRPPAPAGPPPASGAGAAPPRSLVPDRPGSKQSRPEQLGPEQLGPDQLGPEQLGPEQLGPEQGGAGYRRLATLLASAMASGEPLRSVGRREGRRRPAELPLRNGSLRDGPVCPDPVTVMEQVIAQCLEARGPEAPRRDRRGAGREVAPREVVLRACPFEEVVLVAPRPICELHLGIAEGVAERLGVEVEGLVPADPRSHACRLLLSAGGRGRDRPGADHLKGGDRWPAA